MKTIKERAQEYAQTAVPEQILYDYGIDVHVRTFTAGVAFAQRWIPVEEELPENAQKVIMKSDGKTIAGFYEYATFRNHNSELVYNITHWRYIELE